MLTFLLTSFFFFFFFFFPLLLTSALLYPFSILLITLFSGWALFALQRNLLQVPLRLSLFNGLFLYASCLFTKVFASNRGKFLLSYSVLMGLHIELKGYHLADCVCNIQNLNDKVMLLGVLETMLHDLTLETALFLLYSPPNPPLQLGNRHNGDILQNMA